MKKMSLLHKKYRSLLVALSILRWMDPASRNRQGSRRPQLSLPRKSLTNHPFPEVLDRREVAACLLLQQSLPQRSWKGRGGIFIPLLVPVTLYSNTPKSKRLSFCSVMPTRIVSLKMSNSEAVQYHLPLLTKYSRFSSSGM